MKLIRIQELMELTGLCMSTILRMERMGKLPKRRKISTQAMGWLSEEIDEWMRKLPVAPKGVNPAKTHQDHLSEEQRSELVPKCPTCSADTERRFGDGGESWIYCTATCGCLEGLI